MPDSFSALSAAAPSSSLVSPPSASSTAKASDMLARQAQGQDFGQALARSVSSAQHNARREQAAAEAKSAEAHRMDANRTDANRSDAARSRADAKQEPKQEPSQELKKTNGAERVDKRDKVRKGEGSEELARKDAPDAAPGTPGAPVELAALGVLGVLDWLGAQTKVLNQGSESSPEKTTSIDEATPPGGSAAIAANADAVGVQSASIDGDAASQFAGKGAESTALLKPAGNETQVAGSQGLQELQGLEHGPATSDDPVHATPSAAVTHATKAANEAQPGAAVSDPGRRASATRGAPRVANAAGAATGMTPLVPSSSSKGLASRAASFTSTNSLTAASTVSATAQSASGKYGTDPSGSSAFASKADAKNPIQTANADVLISAALDATSSAQAPADTQATPGSAPPPSMLQGHIEAEVGSPAWHQALSQQVMHMRAGKANEAELQLNPAGLGPMRIKLSMNEQQVNAEFTAAHAQVRAALEAALPQLREALQQGGMQLHQVWVDSAGAQTAGSGSGTGNGNGAAGRDDRGPMADSGRGRGSPDDRLSVAAQAISSAKHLAEGTTVRHGPGQRLNTFA